MENPDVFEARTTLPADTSVEIAHDADLEIELLGYRFDDQLGRLDVGEVRGELETFERCTRVVGAQLPTLDGALEPVPPGRDRRSGTLDRRRVDVHAARPIARRRRDLRDPTSHHSGTDDRDLVDDRHVRCPLPRECAA